MNLISGITLLDLQEQYSKGKISEQEYKTQSDLPAIRKMANVQIENFFNGTSYGKCDRRD